MLVHYKGPKKAGMPVILPIGLTSKREAKETVWLSPDADLPDEQAKLLVKLDPHNFELVGKEVKECAHEEVEEVKVPARKHKAKAVEGKVAE